MPVSLRTNLKNKKEEIVVKKIVLITHECGADASLININRMINRRINSLLLYCSLVLCSANLIIKYKKEIYHLKKEIERINNEEKS